MYTYNKILKSIMGQIVFPASVTKRPDICRRLCYILQ